MSTPTKPGSSIAVSRLVNPAHEETKISVEQLWKALERKVHEPQVFLPVFTSCEIVEDDGHKVVRMAHRKAGTPVGGAPLPETCYLFPSSMVYFEAGDRTMRVTNLISYNQSGELLLTYTFANGVPGPYQQGEALDIRQASRLQVIEVCGIAAALPTKMNCRK